MNRALIQSILWLLVAVVAQLWLPQSSERPILVMIALACSNVWLAAHWIADRLNNKARGEA